MCLHNRRQASEHGRLWAAELTLVAALACTAIITAAGCVQPPPPYVPAHREAPKQARCFDGVTHIPGSKPSVLGGACCCTPSDELMAKFHADGVCVELDTQGLINLYHEKGVQLATDHKNCNNLCKDGPHVAKGGKCMVPPRAGTRNYEEVVTGIVFVPPPPAGQKK
jgi:hypothetical protein